MANRRVLADHNRSYETPIIGTVGDTLMLGRRDDDDPHWIWCEHTSSALAGWVPESFLEPGTDGTSATLRRDYSAIELTVSAGDTVTIIETVAGWCWCSLADGESGWVPSRNLTIG